MKDPTKRSKQGRGPSKARTARQMKPIRKTAVTTGRGSVARGSMESLTAITRSVDMAAIKKAHYENNLTDLDRRHWDSKRFIWACRDATCHELAQNTPLAGAGRAEFLLSEVISEAVAAVEDLVAAGHLRLAGRLPGWKARIDKAHDKFRGMVAEGKKELQWFNRFAGHMQSNELWNSGVRVPIQWPEASAMPVKTDWRAWTKLAMSYLRKRFGEQPWQVTVFLAALARWKAPSSAKDTHPIPPEARRLLSLYCPEEAHRLEELEAAPANFKETGKLRLIHCQPSYQWKAIEKQLKRAFQRLAKTH